MSRRASVNEATGGETAACVSFVPRGRGLHVIESNSAASPCEVFPQWHRAQVEVDRRAQGTRLSPYVLRTTGFLGSTLAERVTEWFMQPATSPGDGVRRSYRALARETAWLLGVAERGLGVRVRYIRSYGDPYRSAAELCAELRDHRSMTLSRVADEPHPLLEADLLALCQPAVDWSRDVA